jgi:hypothetical protein
MNDSISNETISLIVSEIKDKFKNISLNWNKLKKMANLYKKMNLNNRRSQEAVKIYNFYLFAGLIALIGILVNLNNICG